MQSQRIQSTGLISSLGGALLVASLMVSSQARAADIYNPPASLKDSPAPFAPSLWPGFYIGGHAGGAWSSKNVSDTFDYGGDPTFKGDLGGTGFIGGLQAGYNVQRGHLVFGLEGDIGYLDLAASKSASFRPDIDHCGTKPEHSCDMDTRYSASGGLYGDLTGRIGYAAERTLLYVKGGVAFLDADIKAKYSGQNYTTLDPHVPDVPANFNYSHDDTLVGWTIGAGVEYALTPSWSLKAEYRHFDFGEMSYSYSDSIKLPCTNCYSKLEGKTDVSLTADAVTLGVNYRINDEAARR
jgi:outer membrane immunogenic protein